MKMARLCKTAKTLMWIVVLVGLIPSGSYTAWANPGLLPTPDGRTAYVEFSGFPNGDAVRQGIEEWRAQGWNQGERSLQLIREGGYLEIVLQIPASVSTARLAITHRSGYAPSCASGGSAPVALTVNGGILAQHYVPPAAGSWSTSFTTDSWDLTSVVSPGRNRIRITAGNLCSVYEIRRLEVRLISAQSRFIETVQMTHGVSRDDRPIDTSTAFSPFDPRAVCWLKVAPAARGKRLEWRFYDPSGHLYFKTDRSANRYNWGWIRVRNWRAADLRGQWRVDVYLAGQLQASLPFSIGGVWAKRSVPRVVTVDFPERIVADGVKRRGWVRFHDSDGDIASVRFDVVEAVHFTPFSFEPNVSGETDGTFRFRVYCNTRQTVTLKVTLYDRQGNKSEPYYFSFRAT